MIMGLAATTNENLNTFALEQGETDRFVYSDGSTRYIAHNIMSPACDRLIDAVAAGNASLQTFNIAFFDDEPGAIFRDGAVGAMILADDFLKIDPANEFSPALASPCYGLIPKTRILKTRGKPQGPVIHVKHETIFSSPVRDLFRRFGEFDEGDVANEEGLLTEWKRVFPKKSLDLISEEGLRRLRCLACGAWMRVDAGVWIGHNLGDFGLCSNKTGIGHLDREHPLIIDNLLARYFHKLYGNRCGLAPIIDCESEWGRRALEVIARLAPLVKQEGGP